MRDDGIVLVIGSGAQRYREYLLASAGRRRPLWLIDAAAATWQAPHVVGGSVVPMVDPARLIHDYDGIVDAAEAVAGRHRVVGAFSYDEMLVETTARIAERLGVPGLTLAGARRCRNKHSTRAELTAAGLVQPRFAFATDAAQARAAAADFGYPVVVKPRGMGASIGVVRVEDEAGMAAAFAVADAASYGPNPAYDGGALVEEFLTGPEISVDGAVTPDGYHPFFLARKRTGLEPYFEETGHIVDTDDPLLRDEELLETLSAAHRALGVRAGVTHTEVKLTGRGPAIVEVNARLGGDLIPYVGRLASGVDPGYVAADVAAGAAPDLRPAHRRCAGIRFSYPPRDGRVRRVYVPAAGEATGLVEAAAIAAPGAVLRLPPRAYLSRYAYVICVTDTPESCERALTAASLLTGVALDEVGDDEPAASFAAPPPATAVGANAGADRS